MKLYFLRHADALDGIPDEARVLSPEGRRQAHALGKFLKRAGLSFDTAYASPLRRAVQTAEIVLRRCDASGNGVLQTDDTLLNQTLPDAFDHWLAGLGRPGHVLLVGHMPSLSEHLCRWLKGARPEALALPKCGLAGLEITGPREARLRLFLSPRLLGACP
jgi:phosphohistidine phosphatase